MNFPAKYLELFVYKTLFTFRQTHPRWRQCQVHAWPWTLVCLVQNSSWIGWFVRKVSWNHNFFVKFTHTLARIKKLLWNLKILIFYVKSFFKSWLHWEERIRHVRMAIGQISPKKVSFVSKDDNYCSDFTKYFCRNYSWNWFHFSGNSKKIH